MNQLQIYLARDKQQAGPYSLNEFNTMLLSGEVVNDDLMWHFGMDTWQSVGQMTAGQKHYLPSKLPDNGDHLSTNQPADSSDQNKRMSVAELYGRKPQSHTANHDDNVANSTPSEEEWQGRHHNYANDTLTQTQVVYAGVGSRFLAFCINMVLFVLALMPMTMALIGKINPEDLQGKSYSQINEISQSLAMSMPSLTVILTTFLMIALASVQCLMLALRGQSLGKLAVGIRVVDENTHHLPNFMNMVVIRTVLLFVIYQVALSFMQVIGIGLLAVNYFMAVNHPKKQGWHDKLAKTVVVKASPDQLKKLNSP